MNLGLEHSYAALPPGFHVRVQPTSVVRPSLVVFNPALAADLGWDAAAVELQAGRDVLRQRAAR